MTNKTDGLARSVHTRLVRHAQDIGVDPNLVLSRYAMERFLYRLSKSPHADRFVLKGALLLLAWLGETLRPTRDADVLGVGDLSDAALTAIFSDVCSVRVEPDGMTYLADTITVRSIRDGDDYGGRRITLRASLGSGRQRVQIDVGIGDVVTPRPEWLDYPALLDFPPARLRTYSRATVIAEKLHAIVKLGAANSRMKDYFDIAALAREGEVTGPELRKAVDATFRRRQTEVPAELPVGLTDELARTTEKQVQWQAFLRKNGLDEPEFDRVVARVRDLAFEAGLW